MKLFDAAPAEPRRLTLIRLAAEIARAAADVGRVAVEGEVHRPSRSQGGWVFFTLRDRAAQVSVVVTRTVAVRSRIEPGERVLVVGQLEWHNERGHLQFRADEVTPVGAGAVAALIAETRRRLDADGVLHRPRRPLPVLPRCVGVVCGADAAVRKDIESVVVSRFPGYPVRFTETTVTGPGASTAIADAVQAAVRSGADVLVLARGGGDATALLPWSTEEVCRAIAACPIPVVSAIGHDGDRPLCDEVADLRCGTPSIAAAAVVPDEADLRRRMDACLARCAELTERRVQMGGRQLAGADTGGALRSGVERAGVRLARAGERLEFVHPRQRVARATERIRALDWRRPIGERVGRAAGRLQADGRHLSALSPQRTLERGYAVARGPDGAVLRRAGAVSAGDRVDVRLAAGRLGAVVEEIET